MAPRLVEPGSPGDYFAGDSGDGATAWRDEEHEYAIEPANVAYYRLGEQAIGDRDTLFEFAVPMTKPELLDGHHKTMAAATAANVVAPLFDFVRLSDIRHANWNRRGSVPIGTCAGASVYWCYESGSVSILVGHDGLGQRIRFRASS